LKKVPFKEAETLNPKRLFIDTFFSQKKLFKIPLHIPLRFFFSIQQQQSSVIVVVVVVVVVI